VVIINIMSDNNSESLESVMREIKNLYNEINAIKIAMNDVNLKSSEIIVVSENIKQFMSRFTSTDVDAIKPTKSKAKTSTKKTKKTDVDNIEALEPQIKEASTSNYNVFVSLVKGQTDFAHKVAATWSSEDSSIPNDPKQINYVEFYNLFISSKVDEDTLSDPIKKIRSKVAKERAVLKANQA